MFQSSPVAPFAGAWIEMSGVETCLFHKKVAPFAGAWIEIKKPISPYMCPSVAPFAGAWIEMIMFLQDSQENHCRSLRGSVD